MNGKYIKIKMGIANSYLIKGNSGYILVDAGVEGTFERLKAKMKEYHIKYSDIKLIIITHVHYDHVGNLQIIKKKTQAPVLVHVEEAELLKKGESYLPGGNSLLGGLGIKIMGLIKGKQSSFKPVKADIEIRDYYDIRGFGFEGEVIHTPGHSAGSICLIIENRHCFVGDTMFSFVPFTINPPFADDAQKLYRSWEKIAKSNCQIFYPGHGYIFHRQKLINNLNKKRKKFLK